MHPTQNISSNSATKKFLQTESFRDRLATVDSTGKRKWVFAHKPAGKFYNARTYVSWGFFILFITLPFIYINGHPLFLFNIPAAKFILFAQVFWPQDFFIFGLIMVTSIVAIVLFTAAFGRLFCGWVCPQTIFMEMLFRKIEFFIEGSAATQKLATKHLTTPQLVRKIVKHISFFILAFIIANFFLSYIIGYKELFAIIKEPIEKHVTGFASIILFSAVFYGVYAFFREQSCTVVCPYGRLQSVLLDKNSVIVAYDYKRGEQRKKWNKKEERTSGDCIDCFQCVKVCPTGIDIRNGTQMECVACTACIDACDSIMESVGLKKGLIRYASENGIAQNKPLVYSKRMKFYTVLLILLVALLTTLLVTRKNVQTIVMRTPGLMYQEVGADSISNLYNLKAINKSVETLPLRIEVLQQKGSIKLMGKPIIVKPEAQAVGTFFIVMPKQQILSRKNKVTLAVYNGNKKIQTITTNFFAPNN